MTNEFLLVLALAGFGILASVPMLVIPLLLAPRRPNPIKNAPFECGQMPTGEGRVHFIMQYYAYLLMFVVFDVMVMFLFAWAVSYRGIGLAGTPILLGFLAILSVPLGYALHMAGRREAW